MNVTLTQTQYRTLLRHTDGALYNAFTFDTAAATKTQVEIRAPYIAWQIINDRLVQEYSSRSVGSNRPVQKQIMRMLHRIATSQNRVMRHPALKGLAMLGTHGGWFPVWIDAQGWRSPVPTDGVFTVLGPRLVDSGRAPCYTVWTEDGSVPTDDWLAQEQTHTALL